MRVLLFTGAGASVELGVPAMRSMVEQFGDHLSDHGIAARVVDKLQEHLEASDFDMEHLIDQLDNIESGLSASPEWGIEPIKSTVAGEIGVVRLEAEWFVLHVCERVVQRMARSLWGATLRALNGHDATIVTTNYDRAVEIAASHVKIALTDGYASFGDKEYASWNGFGDEPALRLVKLHGSTDWYHSLNGSAVKLRHAMPLYGTLTVGAGQGDDIGLTSAAVLPSREKKVTQAPYPKLSFEFQKAAAAAEIALFVGTSLRDPDISSIFRECSTRVPTVLVTPSGVPGFGEGEGEWSVVKETASQFLVSTLPGLMRVEPNELSKAVMQTAASTPRSILEWYSTAFDVRETSAARCQAIEKLADAGVSLGAADLLPMLKDDERDVRLFALALVQGSLDEDRCVNEAEALAAAGDDIRFSDEVGYLKKLMERAPVETTSRAQQ